MEFSYTKNTESDFYNESKSNKKKKILAVVLNIFHLVLSVHTVIHEHILGSALG